MPAYNKQLKNLEKELQELQEQKLNLYDLLERNIYDVNTFVERSKNISERIDNTNKNIEVINTKIKNEEKRKRDINIIPKIKMAMDAYYNTDDVLQKNMLLKNILEKVEYNKEKDQRNDNFTLTLYPKLPE